MQDPPKRGRKRVVKTVIEETKTSKRVKKQEFSLSPEPRLLKEGGYIHSFGQGDFGQLGLGEDALSKARPAVIPGHEDVVAIAAGAMHSVCLTKSGKVITFGCNDEGALGRKASDEDGFTPGLVDLPDKAVQISAGDSHTAALLQDGRVFAWGTFRDSHGSMGLTEKGKEELPVEILKSKNIVKIASGADHLVLLDNHGQIYTCGCGEQGQLGRISARSADRHSRRGLVHLVTPDLVEFKGGRKLKFDDIWTATYCTFAKSFPDGKIYAFGLNNHQQIGLAKGDVHFYPSVSETFNGKKWTHICGGQHHTIALDDNGGVYVMGRKEYGRLGLGAGCADASSLTPVPTLSALTCIDVGAGSAQSYAVTNSGELYSWGMGTTEQLGTGNDEDVETPVLVKGKQLEGKSVMRVSGGGQHTLILSVKKNV